ncbi:hypothetical protein B4168_0131 [Anoxybacillus flavithermus]|nr:hypothetical protein B4168_0131 [Anoxybacillus flavithermus]OAO88947.1 hypothetical protein GT23_0187 [Parageobacillus thermoglucosidasius]
MFWHDGKRRGLQAEKISVGTMAECLRYKKAKGYRRGILRPHRNAAKMGIV